MNKDALVGWEPQGFGGEDVLSFAWSALMESQFNFFLIATREKMPGEKLQTSKMSNVQLQTVLNQQSLRRDDGFSPSKVQECNGELPIEHASAKFQPLRSPKTNDQCYFPILNGCFGHAADTAPLEGLSILRCAIYDPVEGLQISKMRFSEMGV